MPDLRPPDTFGARLRAAMKAKGMRASDIAHLRRVSRKTVGRWLWMDKPNLRGDHLIRIAMDLDVDVYQLALGPSATVTNFNQEKS